MAEKLTNKCDSIKITLDNLVITDYTNYTN